MRKKLLLPFLLLACFFAAWIGVSYAKLWFSDRSESSLTAEKSVADTTVASERKDVIMLPSVFDDFVRSEKPLVFEMLLEDLDMDSLDSILAIEDDPLRRLAIDEYLRKLPMNTFPEMIRYLILQIQNRTESDREDYITRKIGCLDQMISVWFERDFERAKKFVLSDMSLEEKIDEENDSISLNLITEDFQLNAVQKHAFRGYLLKEWMKRNKTECLEFVRTNNSEKNEWVNEFVRIFFYHYPRESYSLMEAYPEYWKEGWRRNGSYSLFQSWYNKEGDLALEAILNISSNQIRKNALETILMSIAWKNPNQAVDVIRREYPSDNGSKPYFFFQIGRAMDYLSLDLIRQGQFSDSERKALVRGYVAEISLTSLNELLEDERHNFSEEERFMLIKERLCSAVSYQTGTGTTHMDMVSISEEESHLALQLFRELSVEEQEVVCVNRLDANDKKLSLFMYDELPPEKQLSATRQKLFEGLIREDVVFASEYFLDHFRDGSLVTQDVKFGNVIISKGKSENEFMMEIVERYSEEDTEGAERWVSSIPDDELRKTAIFLLSAVSWKNDTATFISQLNTVEDEKLRNSVFDSIVSDELFSNPESLLTLVNGVKDAALAKRIVDDSGDHFLGVSSDAVFDFIDGLERNSGIQEYAQEKFYDKALKQDPKLALEIALDMPPGEVTTERIQRALSLFQRETPERAARWLKENNIKLSQ